jgi:type II secretory pathway predicted ATPase ExeA
MHFFTPESTTVAASGTAMFLFGLLVLSVKYRKMATRYPYAFYVSPSRGAIRPAPRNQSAQGFSGSLTASRNSSFFFSASPESAPRDPATNQAPEIPANQLATPVDFSAPRVSGEMKIDSTPFPFEEVQPGKLAEIPVQAAAGATPLLQEPFQKPFQKHGNEHLSRNTWKIKNVKNVEDRAAKANSIAPNPGAANGDSSKTREVIVSSRKESAATASPVLPATNGTPATADILGFHGLKQQPFDVTPDPSYLYFTPSHREALTSLTQGIEHFRGFMMLVAEPGMGKTTLLNKLMEELSNSARVVFLFQTQCSSSELLSYILNELEVDHTGMDVVAMHRALNQALLEEMLRGQRFVLIVDEAQNDALEADSNRSGRAAAAGRFAHEGQPRATSPARRRACQLEAAQRQ